jgi:haloalkane dehalogenase
MKALNAYPMLSERSRGWLKYLHRKVNTPDDWDRGGHPSQMWDDKSFPPILCYAHYDLLDSSYAMALMAETTPAWREVYGSILDQLLQRFATYWGAIDWGSALGFSWAQRHPERIKGIAYMEAIVRPVTWDEWPEQARSIFQAMRSPAGEQLILEENVFVERILPASVMRHLSEEEMAAYRRPYLQPGETRRPTLTWPRELPIEGEPQDVTHIVKGYAQWLSTSQVPKLFVNADPGAILTGAQREFCRIWPHQEEITVKGIHFIQEDSPAEIGVALADFVKRISA